MTAQQKRRLYVAGIVAVIIVILLLWKRGATNIDRRVQKPGDVFVTPITQAYDVIAPVHVPTTDYDWMSSTLGCDCDESVWTPTWEAPEPIIISYPVYSYASASNYSPTVFNANFAIYEPPPPPSWWFAVLKDVDGVEKSLRLSSTGEWFRLGKYGTFSRDTHRYTEYTMSGDSLYWDAQRFKHDASKDSFPSLAPIKLPNVSAWG